MKNGFLTIISIKIWLSVCALIYAAEPIKAPFDYWKLDKNEIKWGAEKIGMKAGMSVVVVSGRSDPQKYDVWLVPWCSFQTNNETKFYVGYTNGNTNCFIGHWEHTVKTNRGGGLLIGPYAHAEIAFLRPLKNNFLISLRDDSGMEILTTKNGDGLGQAILNNYAYEDGRGSSYTLTAGEIQIIGAPILLNDHFKISKPGKYRLQFHLRLFCVYGARTIHEKYVPIILPPVNAEFEVKERDR